MSWRNINRFVHTINKFKFSRDYLHCHFTSDEIWRLFRLSISSASTWVTKKECCKRQLYAKRFSQTTTESSRQCGKLKFVILLMSNMTFATEFTRCLREGALSIHAYTVQIRWLIHSFTIHYVVNATSYEESASKKRYIWRSRCIMFWMTKTLFGLLFLLFRLQDTKQIWVGCNKNIRFLPVLFLLTKIETKTN